MTDRKTRFSFLSRGEEDAIAPKEEVIPEPVNVVIPEQEKKEIEIENVIIQGAEKIGEEMQHRIMEKIVNQPGYDQMPDLVKRRIFAKVLTASHQYAAVQALPMGKRVQLLQSITEKVAAELLPPEQ